MDNATEARLMCERGNPPSLAAGHCLLIKEGIRR